MPFWGLLICNKSYDSSRSSMAASCSTQSGQLSIHVQIIRVKSCSNFPVNFLWSRAHFRCRSNSWKVVSFDDYYIASIKTSQVRGYLLRTKCDQHLTKLRLLPCNVQFCSIWVSCFTGQYKYGGSPGRAGSRSYGFLFSPVFCSHRFSLVWLRYAYSSFGDSECIKQPTCTGSEIAYKAAKISRDYILRIALSTRTVWRFFFAWKNTCHL